VKVKYEKDKTIITLDTKEERQYIFGVLSFYKREHLLREKDSVDKLLDKWMEEAWNNEGNKVKILKKAVQEFKWKI